MAIATRLLLFLVVAAVTYAASPVDECYDECYKRPWYVKPFCPAICTASLFQQCTVECVRDWAWYGKPFCPATCGVITLGK